MNKKAIIFGIKGKKLTKSEIKFFKKFKPWGIILFSRNINDIFQLKSLVQSIKKLFNDNKYPILIDQEGGKVNRLNKIIDLSFFSQDYFAKLFLKDKKKFLINYKIYINTISNIFNFVGININTVPVLDVRSKQAHSIIGTRSFSKNPIIVSTIGSICIKLFKGKKIATVVKHIPGHGLSKCDSHYQTPIIRAKKSNLIKRDFRPFKLCKSQFAMTGHVIYLSYDKKNTATHSKVIIKDVIRNHIKFKGILMSDDISMKSLKYKLEENAVNAYKAGCNLVLHCNGNLNEMIKLSKVVPEIDNFIFKKTSDFYKFLG